MTQASAFIIPAITFFIVGYGMLKKISVYEVFLTGAREGLRVVIEILPTLIGLMVAVGVLRASGIFLLIERFCRPLGELLHFPEELIPLWVVKLFSSSAATGLLLDIYQEYGPDSYLGVLASILCSCTETLFYTLSVYCMAARVTKTGDTIKGALLATLMGTIASVLLNPVH